MADIQMIECDEIPKWDYPDVFQCYLRKECIAFQVWEYSNRCNWISDIWNDDYAENININNVVCGMFICKDCIILVSHGGDDGTIKRYDLLLDILTSPDYAGMPIYIQCCYPYYVAQTHPELKPYLLNSTHKLHCGIRMDTRNQYIELFTGT